MKVGTQSIKDHAAHLQLDQLTGLVHKDHETSSPGELLSHINIRTAQSRFQNLRRAKLSDLLDLSMGQTILMAHSHAGEEVGTMEKRLSSQLN